MPPSAGWNTEEKEFGGSRFGWMLVGVLASLLGIGMALAGVLGSYGRVDVPASVAYIGADGPCDGAAECIGRHSFGDYVVIHFASPTSEPTSQEAVYPASSRLLRLPFHLIERAWGYSAGLWAYLITSALCLLAPIIWAVRRVPWVGRVAVISVAGVATAPAMFALDRGNTVALLVPLLFGFVMGVLRDRPWLAAVMIVVAATVKPHYALLFLALVAMRAWKPAAVAALGSLVAVVLPFLLYGAGLVAGTEAWVRNARAWAGSGTLSQPWPVNGSFSRALYWAIHRVPGVRESSLGHMSDSAYVTISFVFLALVTAVVIIAGKALPRLAIAALAVAIVSLALPISYGYYFVFALPLVAIAFRTGLGNWPTARRFDKALVIVFAVALVASLTPILIPVSRRVEVAPGTLVVGSFLPLVATCAWAVFAVLLASSGAASARVRFGRGRRITAEVEGA